MGYTTMVFERLEYTDWDDHYLMCVQFPNWQQKVFKKEEIGYVTVRYVREGVDKWFDGQELVPYKCTNIIFLKFIKATEEIDLNNINVD